MAAVGTGRRERKKRSTRQELRLAALRLASERGVDRVTVEDITEAVDVAPRTFFNYFSSKDDALVEEMPEVAEELAEAVAARPAAEPLLATLQAVLRQVVVARTSVEHQEESRLRRELVAQNPRLLPRQMARYAALERVLGEALAERVDSGSGHGPRAELLASVGVAVVRAAARRWNADRRRSLGQLVDEAFAALTAEFSEPPGAGGSG